MQRHEVERSGEDVAVTVRWLRGWGGIERGENQGWRGEKERKRGGKL